MVVKRLGNAIGDDFEGPRFPEELVAESPRVVGYDATLPLMADCSFAAYPSSMHVRTALSFIAVSAMVAACSGNVSFSIGGQSAEDAASELIEGDLSEQVGLTLTASCPELEDPAQGDQFDCTGTADDGRVIIFTVDIGDNEVFANSTNMLVASAVPGFEQSIVDALNTENALELPDGSLDCGNGPIIVGSDSTVLCRLNDPNSADVYDTTITITDQANWRFNIDVANEPS